MKNTVRKSDVIIVISLILIFSAIIFMNTRLINKMMLEQVEQVNQNRVEIIRSDYENASMEAENVLVSLVSGVERIYYAGKERKELFRFIEEQHEALKERSDGAILRVYAVGEDWQIMPDTEIPTGYRAADQEWYTGALEKQGALYFADPHYDSLTGVMCYTLTMMVDDGKTVVGMDITMDGVKSYIDRISGEDRSMALILTDEGQIVGYTDMSYVGKMMTQVLPEYSVVLDRLTKSTTDSNSYFEVAIGGKNYTVFHSAMRNGWYMALFMNDRDLYGEANTQRWLNIVVNVLLLLLIVTAILTGSRNRIRAQEALQSRELFVSRILDNLREPLGKILRLSDMQRFNNSTDIKADMADIKVSSLQLKEMMDNLRSYSSIVTGLDKNSGQKKKERLELAHSIKIFRNVIIVILLVVSVISMLFYIRNRRSVIRESVAADLDTYSSDLNKWEREQSTIMQTITDMLSSQPQILEDYDSTVEWMDRMAKQDPAISVCYIANPFVENRIIMNNGWKPDADWDFTTREWYIEAVNHPDKVSVSKPYIEITGGNYCVTIAKAVFSAKNGQFLGVFGMDYYLDKLIDILRDKGNENEYVFLVDSAGIILNHPNPAYQLTMSKKTSVTDTPYAGVYLAAGKGAASDIRNIRDYDDSYGMCICKGDPVLGFSVIMVGNWWQWYKEILLYCGIYMFFVLLSILTVLILLNRVIRSQADMNRELTITADRAMAAGQAKSDFLAQMSHEIRTPINAVIGMDEMILRENQDPDIREYAENIKSASQTLLTLINGILDFSKIESGKLEILPVRYETLEMIDNLVNMISARTEKKGLNLILNIDPKLPRSLFGDDVRIRQIITNLLTNAVKYTREGDVTLSIWGSPGLSEDDYHLRVAVKDTGIGIKPEDKDKLFRSFERLDEEKNRNIEGTGLGMSIVQGLLSMMDSKLDVESEYGIGSTFSFEINQKIIDGTEIGEYAGHRKREAEEVVQRKTLLLPGANILVVDDNDMNLKVAKGLMKRYGIVPDLAESGKICISMVKEKTYDLILMDHMMPGMDGVDTLKKIREEKLAPEEMPIIALTANAIVGAREEYIAHGFKDYLSKPIDVVALEDILIKYLPKEKVKYKEDDAEFVAQLKTGAEGRKAADHSANEAEALGQSETGAEATEALGQSEPGAEATKAADQAINDAVVSEASDQSEQSGSFTDRLAAAGFNIEEAHSFTMEDDEFYMELLETYISGAEEKRNNIKKFYDEENWKDYQIAVHGLKSSSRTLGADQLADLAYAQELAAKALQDGSGTEDAIRGGIEELLRVYNDTVEAIQQAIHS